MAPGRARELIERFSGIPLLVIGDVILDRYIWGEVERISPEAPVPVVQTTRESTMLGGAGNVARNLASLGARVDVAAVVGDDETGAEIARLLSDWKIDPSGLLVDSARPTTMKTRIIARAQQVVRFDRESEDPLEDGVASRLIETIRGRASRVAGAVLEDYGKGVLSERVVREVMSVLAANGVPVFVDPKQSHWEAFRGCALLKPNLREAEAVAGVRARGDADVEGLGRLLLERTGAEAVAITRGADGMTVCTEDGGLDHVATARREVAEASGAGDTAIAVLALARLAGGTWEEAASVANAAAGVVVGVPGTATVSPRQLIEALAGRA